MELAPLTPVIDGAEARALQRLAREVPAADPALRYAARRSRAPRGRIRRRRPNSCGNTCAGARVPRAGQALILGAKAAALLAGRLTVAPEDIRRVARPVLRHRVLPNFAAEAEGVNSERIVEDLLASIAAPRSDLRL